jgi:hypothetical protein
MNKTLTACVVSAAMLAPLAATAADRVARFEDGIGSQPLRSPVAPAVEASPNLAFGVRPGGIPWVISRLSADVSSDGRIRVDGRGLLLAGGNGIGTNGGQSVRARLFCNGVASGDSDLVELDAAGDFRINGSLSQNPPSPCGGNWFAAGIPKN